MKRICAGLEIAVDEETLAEAVEKHSWETIPDGDKGPGMFHRKATPGGWKDDLTAEQVETIERIIGPIVREFYS